ncbi:MAG: hypothetical protein AAFZ18_22815 [Myxococcota bacterium]
MLALLALALGVAPPTDAGRLLDEARTALRGRDLDAAAELCRAAAKEGEEVEEALALQLCGKIELRRDRARAAVKMFRAALFAVPVKPKLRARLRADWRRALHASRRPLSPTTTLARADRVVDRLAARPRQSERQLERRLKELDAARKTLLELGDRRRASYASAVRRWVLARSEQPERALRGLDRLVRSKTRSVRRLARQAQAEAHLALEQAGPAALAAAWRILDAPDEDKDGPLRPDRLLRTACRDLGAEACARQVRKRTRRFLITDHSGGRARAQRPPEVVEALHAEATVALEDCLLTHARADPERYSGVRLELSWVVDDGGRAASPEIVPRRHAELAEGCVAERLTWLRYPKLIGGAHETVTIAFGLN